MTPARQPPNPDMHYSALERLDIKFTELIGAIEEKQVDGQLSSKDHSDYELVCYCRGFIRAELEKERRATHTSATAQCGVTTRNFNDGKGPIEAQQRIKQTSTDVILKELKRRYKGELAILDYIEMIECEVIALLQAGRK